MKRIAPLVLLLTFAGCSPKHNDPAPSSSNTFVIHVSPDLNTTNSDNGVLFHDKNGKSLGWKSFEGGDSIEMSFDKAAVGDTIMVTVYQAVTAVGQTAWTLQTYCSVPANDSWQIGYIPVDPNAVGSIQGKFNVTVTGQIFPTDVWLTNNYGYATSQQISNNTDYFAQDVFSNAGFSFLYANGINGPRYKRWDKPQINTKDSVDYSQLSSFDNVVTLKLTHSVNNPYVDVLGYDPDNSATGAGALLYTTAISASTTTDAINVNYASGFTQYSTYLSWNFPDYEYSYVKRGAMIGQLDIPAAADFKTTNKAFTSFAYTSARSFARRETEFSFTSSPLAISWLVTARAGAPPILDLPSDFSTAYPSIKLSDLNAIHSDFYILSSKSFSDVVAEKFKGKTILVQENASEGVD